MNDYIKTMRSMIGKKPLLLCGASVMVIRDREILLQRRRDNGCWGYHGGSLELGERLEDTARRELLEETGLEAGKLRFYGVFSGPELHTVLPNGDELYFVDVVYLCDDFTGTLRPQPEEVLELKWFAFDALPEDMNPSEAGIIREFFSKKQNNSD